MKAWQGIILGLFCGLLAAGVILVIARAPRGEGVVLLPPPTPAPLIVDVSGAVRQPGVYQLPSNSRVQDAVAAAGGLKPEAQAASINLAAPLSDGQKIHIPAEGEPTPVVSRNTVLQPAGSSGALTNINTASLNELENLPGIGPTKAQNILAYRDTHGPFQHIEDIQDVPGIGEGIFQTIKDRITVE